MIDGGAMICAPKPAYFVYRMQISDHIQTGLDTAVRLQADLAPQVVSAQRLLGFTQAQFPGEPA